MKTKVNMKRFAALFLLICTISAFVAFPVQAAIPPKLPYISNKIEIVPSGKTAITITNTNLPSVTVGLLLEAGKWNYGSPFSPVIVINKGQSCIWTGVKNGTKFRVCANKPGLIYKISFSGSSSIYK